MDYLNEVRCNGTVFRWPVIVVEPPEGMPGTPRVKFTLEVAKKLKYPRKLPDGRMIEWHRAFWKCSVSAYVDRLPLFEAAKNLSVGQQVFVRGEFYVSPYKGLDGTSKMYYGIRVYELDLPHTKFEDNRVQSLIKTTIKPWRQKIDEIHKGVSKDKHGQETILDGGVGKEKLFQDEYKEIFAKPKAKEDWVDERPEDAPDETSPF